MAILGIDLGTTNSLISIWKNNEIILVPNSLGELLTPSIVSINRTTNTVYVGKIAKELLVSNPASTASLFKRSMGTKRKYSLANNPYDSEELSALLLKTLKEDAERYLGESLEEAVISVPAYFNDLQRSATKRAGELAGLNVERLINEPSAAALFCKTERGWSDATIMVFDFGGGTLDVSLVECFDNVVNVIAISGDNKLGGSDFDLLLAEYFCYNAQLDYYSLSAQIQQSLLQKCELAKQLLSTQESTDISCQIQNTLYATTIDRQTLVNISANVFKRISVPIERVMSDSQLQPADIDEIIMVGGSSKMPIVQQYLGYLFKGRIVSAHSPDTAVALGVGIYAGMKERNESLKDLVLTDICPFSLGTGIVDKLDSNNLKMSIIIERNTPLPTAKCRTYSTISDFQKEIAIGVFQGEAPDTSDNQQLAEFSISIPAAPKGKELVNVTYAYDINGILVVTALVVSTKKLYENIVTQSSQLSPEEIQKKIAFLRSIKLPKDEPENKLLLEKLKRLFMESIGVRRESIESLTNVFSRTLHNGSVLQLKRVRKQIEAALEQLDKNLMPDIESFDDDWYQQALETDVSRSETMDNNFPWSSMPTH